MTQEIGIKKNDILENIEVEKLVFWWKGFARLSHSNPAYDGRVIFITGWAIPWAVVNLRVIKKKNAFLETQIVDVIKKSPFEEENKQNKYWECGWCKWVNIKYEKQLEIKEQQVKEALKNLWKYDENLENKYENIEPSPTINWYRNKVEFSFWKYISKKEWKEEHFNLGFHKQW
jgi:23S rRNA (uracil1939-C5)-methyltransferase